MSGHPHQATSLLIILSILIPFSQFIRPSEACGVTVYWGQNGNEGSLLAACSNYPASLYNYVAIAFLTTFGSGQTPVLNLAGHCDPPSGTCKNLSSEIEYCQGRGIKVLLSLGGAVGSYNLSSENNAYQVAEYLYNNYLGGASGGPLGDVALDGVDFDIESPGSTLYWDDLAIALTQYSTPRGKVYLSAAPQCPLPDPNLDAAIKTGVFDYVWVQFYNNPQCDIGAGVPSLLSSWYNWSSHLPAGTQLFMGLPAAPSAAGRGYMEPDVLNKRILPVISQTRNYGGIMLWNRYYDLITNYSTDISKLTCSSSTRKHDELLLSQVV